MRSWGILPLVLLALPACNRDNEPAEEVAADTVNVESAETVRELLAPVRAVSIAVVEFGNMGQQRAQRPDVRQFAGTVATDHRALIAVLDSAAQASGAALGETPAAQELSGAVRMAHAGLEGLPAADFDLGFVRAQLESHRQLLDRLDQHVIPATTSPQMRTLVTHTRAMVDAHLTRARQLLAALLGQAPEPPPAAGTPRPQTQPSPQPQQPAPPPPPPPDTIAVSR